MYCNMYLLQVMRLDNPWKKISQLSQQRPPLPIIHILI